MNIAYIVPSLANKGPVIVVQDLCRQFVESGHRCKVFYFDDITELDMPCETERIRFRQKIDFAEWDVVHSHMLRPDLWVWLHKPAGGRTKFVTTVHQHITETLCSDYGKVKGLLVGRLWRMALRRFDRVAVLTRTHAESIPEVPASKKTVVFNGRDVDMALNPEKADIEAVDGLRKTYPVILGSNSIITKRKGLDQIIKALPLLPHCAYVAIGAGPETDSLKQMAAKLGVADRCLWLGFKPNGYRYYKLIDIYMIPSHSEGFPLSLIEAAAMGKTAVCSDIAIFRDIVDHTQVIFAPLDDPQQLASGVEQAVNLSDDLSANLHRLYDSVLTQQKMYSRYLHLYTDL